MVRTRTSCGGGSWFTAEDGSARDCCSAMPKIPSRVDACSHHVRASGSARSQIAARPVDRLCIETVVQPFEVRQIATDDLIGERTNLRAVDEGNGLPPLQEPADHTVPGGALYL
jgi:hypothetical protein